MIPPLPPILEETHVPSPTSSGIPNISSEEPEAQPSESVDVALSFDSRVYQAIWEIFPKGKIDFLEIFSGSAHLSYDVSRSGLRVGQPIDINTGYDLQTPQGRQATWNIIEQQSPTIVWLAVPCTPWTMLQHANPRLRSRHPRTSHAVTQVLFGSCQVSEGIKQIFCH